MSDALRETERLLEIIENLRTHCAWTRALDHQSLRSYLIEESYEVIDAIAQRDQPALRDELGDLLLQILLHSQIAQETGDFGFADVARGLSEKMLRRNRHIFDEQGQLRGDITQDVAQIVQIWDAAKGEEKGQRRPQSGLPAGLPALSLSQKLNSRRRRAGQNPLEQNRSQAVPPAAITDAATLAQTLLAVTARADELGLDAESVLRDALLEAVISEANETSSPE